VGGNIPYLTEVLYIYKNSSHPYYAIINMHCTSHHCQIIINLYTFNTEVPYIYQNSLHLYYDIIKCTKLHIENKPKGCFVSGRFFPPDVLSPWTFCLPDVLYRWTFCPYGHLVPTDVLSHRHYVYGCYVAGRFVSGHFVPLDVLSGHLMGTWWIPSIT
jgi:hypothetical protein